MAMFVYQKVPSKKIVLQFRKQLVGGWTTHLKILVQLDHLPKVRGENKQYLKPPPTRWAPTSYK